MCPAFSHGWLPGMSERDRFEVVDPHSFAADESEAAKRFWAQRGFHAGYAGPRPWSEQMAEQVLRFRPRSVLEFGCNAGRNLAAIRSRDSEVRLLGIDINADAVAYGRDSGLDLRVADEGFLQAMKPGAVDVIFTVSVIDHLPSPEQVLAHMLRVSRIGVILLEPWIGREGRIVRNPLPDEQGGTDTTPYSYSWDYERLAARMSSSPKVDVIPYPLSGTNLGPYYRLYRMLHRLPRRIRYRLIRRARV